MTKTRETQGKTNRHKELALRSRWNGHHQREEKLQVLLRMCTRGNPQALSVGMRTGAATVENSVEVPQKVKNRAIIRSSNSTSVCI